jgi:hypothetical protein
MVVSPRCTAKSQSLQNKGHGSGLRRHAPGLNAKARLAPGSFCSSSIIALGGKPIRTELLFVCMRLRRLGLDKGFAGFWGGLLLSRWVPLDASLQFGPQYSVATNASQQVVGLAGLERFGSDALHRSLA